MRLVAIIGATASGKSDLAFQIASQLEGEIISADSMQIYREMDIGTAKPSVETRSQIKHHLIDILYPDQSFNAGLFVHHANRIIKQNYDHNIPTLLVGGTSLYLHALLSGISKAPEASPEINLIIEGMKHKNGIAECYAQLIELDPESANKLHPNDTSRIRRALQVILMTGKSICDFQREQSSKTSPYEIYYIGIDWPREELYHRINIRVEEMLIKGLIEETEKLLSKGYSPLLVSLNSIGYKQVVAFLEGKTDRKEMVREIQQKSRLYAKKQLTWYRKDQRIKWISPKKSREHLFEEINTFLKK